MKQILRALRGLIVQDKRCQGSGDDAKVCGLKSLWRFMAELHRLGTFFFCPLPLFQAKSQSTRLLRGGFIPDGAA